MVPPAEFRSYYGRQILKTPAWEDKIAYYFFAGGLSGRSALLAARAALTRRPALRRGARFFGRVRYFAVRRRDAEFGEDLFGLIFVDFHELVF